MSKRTVLRRSQLLTAFGPGGMVDLPTRSVLIGGLDRWQMHRGDYERIDEPALARILAKGLRDRGWMEDGETLELRTPPVARDGGQRDPSGVEVTVFPTWFVSERVEQPVIHGEEREGRRLIHWKELDATGGKRKFRNDETGRSEDVTPLRFVGACANGHLQDIDWRRLLHGGAPCGEPMWLTDHGTSGLLGDLAMVCGCGAELGLQELTQPGRLGICEGRMPWLAENAREDCAKPDGRPMPLRLLPRTATNAYFGQTISVISLPTEDDALTDIVRRNLADLSEAESPADIAAARRFNRTLRGELDGYEDETVFDRLQFLRRDRIEGKEWNPRVREFDILASGLAEIGTNQRTSRLFARTLARDAWESGSGRRYPMIQSVAAVHRLREVLCLYGFTRLEPAPSLADGDLDEIALEVRAAPIARNFDWLPAVEQLGEGIFIRFDATAIDQWLGEPAVEQRLDVLLDGYRAHRAKYPSLADPQFPGGPYILLHSLSHALMAEIALACGYPASSLKERVYAFGTGAEGRFGILIYTASLGAEGTLGGLVRMTSRLSCVIEGCLQRLLICSNDPVCADHGNCSRGWIFRLTRGAWRESRFLCRDRPAIICRMPRRMPCWSSRRP